jgi:deoxycytidylate deaminase
VPTLQPTSKYELVIGLVSAVGTDLDAVQSALRDRLQHFGYEMVVIRISELIADLASDLADLVEAPYAARVHSYMTAGNEARRVWERNDAWALAAAAQIAGRRGESEEISKTAYVIRSLKHPAEVEALRQVYGPGFFLLGVYSPEELRGAYLVKDKNVSQEDADGLIARDTEEQEMYGQHTRDTFQLCDAFVSLNAGDLNAVGTEQVELSRMDAKSQIWRILDLLFGAPHETPYPDEYAMFLAYSAALRSADLARQVGAVVVSASGDVVATGANDVPCYGGGLYWQGQKNDARDYRPPRGSDSNAEERDRIVIQVMEKLGAAPGATEEETLAQGRELLKETGLMDLTEFGRAVHAEMEALLACGRSGVSPRGGVLFTTTFPCHNCAKHIVAAGIQRVVYIEPYPKSKAKTLHDDAISLAWPPEDGKVRFEAFVGVGPRRFIDLFSMRLSSGRRLVRKDDRGRAVEFDRGTAIPRGAAERVRADSWLTGRRR